ncbi:carboxylate-amine ligase [Mycobacterium tuberculosis]|uniref:Carboxylate-amine ligase n=1 Tax=Mycobacterium tuberculosis TaxID=1773 RepID=A0A655AY79_MYCTX|nr:carboxylate-amine ligase [Mycobacterium tuberculosis]
MDADSNERLVTDDLADVLTRLEPVAKSLNCADELAAVSDIYDGDLRAVVDALVAELVI